MSEQMYKAVECAMNQLEEYADDIVIIAVSKIDAIPKKSYRFHGDPYSILGHLLTATTNIQEICEDMTGDEPDDND